MGTIGILCTWTSFQVLLHISRKLKNQAFNPWLIRRYHRFILIRVAVSWKIGFRAIFSVFQPYILTKCRYFSQTWLRKWAQARTVTASWRMGPWWGWSTTWGSCFSTCYPLPLRLSSAPSFWGFLFIFLINVCVLGGQRLMTNKFVWVFVFFELRCPEMRKNIGL